MPAPRKDDLDSDSEDGDYVPPNAKEDSASSSDERHAKRARTSSTPPNLTEEEIAAKEEARKALWLDFQAAAATPLPRDDQPPKKLVKIEKRYRFAGETVTEIKEVDADSEEAKKWPVWHSSEPATSTSVTLASPTLNIAPSRTPEASFSQSTPPPTAPTPSGKRPPGRRKPKVQLADLPSSSSQKVKKITTLEKSSMDWQTHVETQTDSQIKDELEANRRGGGYLEKVQFLQRVEDRKDQALDASSDRKRRRN
ncbi:hypothetical protein FA95DRAFT_936599 [Auriscalpium vulgare]|uniref:Uncharacterized protein n=1 Tax=Auriscalpium vulgare TaxID=40419 RepID=A0ACB8S9T5_9AGAM|nr:hypothetical protein FA95DRAFT_936599 [Auriscalpium vulgare]